MSTHTVETADETVFRVVPVKTIEPHPKNPRHKATADDELVTSVKEHGLVQPLVVAQTQAGFTDVEGNEVPSVYRLIGGHRRLAALKKARIKDAPCVVRQDLDTEAKQVEAMLLENSSRTDLSPIEEAEGYQQLLDLKYRQADIARVTGRSTKTVSQRLRLLKLSKTTRGHVHQGQMSIDDAAHLLEFADDPTTTKRLEKAATSGHDFRYELARAQREKKEATQHAATVAELLADGVPELAAPDGSTSQTVHDAAAKLGMERVWATGHNDEAARHRDKGCLTFAAWDDGSEYAPHRIAYFCSNPSSHADELSEDEKQRKEQAEEAERERTQARLDAEAARDVRVDAARTLAASSPDALLSVALPALVANLDPYGGTTERWQELTGVPDAARWQPGARMAGGPDARKLLDHLTDISEWKPAQLRNALADFLIVALERDLERPRHGGPMDVTIGATIAAGYYDLLQAAGHEPTLVDHDLQVRLGLTDDTDAEAGDA